MENRLGRLLLSAAILSLSAQGLRAQQPSAPAPVPALPIPSIGDAAPDFAIRGATRYGLLGESRRLSDFRGETVILALFVIARTRG